jgi:hypothetical protein
MKIQPVAIALAVCVAASSVSAQTVAIEHQPIGCMVADNFPELSACFRPGSDVARARLQFRAAGTIHWYYVEMVPGGACHSAVLPKPKSSTKAIEYYIDVAGKGAGDNRTPDYRPRIASGLGGCKRRGVVAAFVTTASVRLFAPAGAPLVPAGFSGAGVVTTTAAATGPGAVSASGSGGGADVEAASKAKGGKGKAEKVSKSGGGGAGAALGILALGAAGAGVYLVTREDEAAKDDDGDGVSEKDGDCDDTNKAVSPSGGFTFAVDYAWAGTVACSASNPKAQTYRVTNNSCAPLTIQSLTLTLAGSGSCNLPPTSETLPVSVSTVASGATTVIRTGAAAGAGSNLCCTGQRCPPGTCSVSETYTVVTSLGTGRSMNGFAVSDPTGGSCPVCGSKTDWPIAAPESDNAWIGAERSR